MTVINIMTLVASIVALLGCLVSSLYIRRTAMWNKATDAYLRGEVDEGNRLYADAKKFARFLP